MSSEHETKKKQRAQRFGTEYKQPDASGMMDVDLLESRKEASESSSSREETLHVYGVDMLSTSDVLKYFSEYGPQRVEWINDSSCKSSSFTSVLASAADNLTLCVLGNPKHQATSALPTLAL